MNGGSLFKLSIIATPSFNIAGKENNVILLLFISSVIT